MQQQPRILCKCGTINEFGTRHCSQCNSLLTITGRLYAENPSIIKRREPAKTAPMSPPRGRIPARQTPPISTGSQNQRTRSPFTYPKWAIVGVILTIIVVIAASIGWHLFQAKSGLPVGITPTLPPLPSGLGSVKFPNGQYAGVNDGSSFPFDTQRKDPQNLRLQAMKALQAGDSGKTESLWNQYLSEEFPEASTGKRVKENENDAEILIYLENQYIVNTKYVTLIVGIDFPIYAADSPDAIASTRNALQGAYTAQKEFNDQTGDLKLRLLVVNTADDGAYVVPVAQQMASIISKSDKTVIGILGWQTSRRTESMLTDLKNDGIAIPMVSQTASSDHLAEEHWNNLFQIAALNNAQAQAAMVQTKKLGATKAIVFMDQGEPYSQNLGQDIKQDFEQAFPASPPPLEEDFQVENTSTAQFSQLLKDGLKKVNYNQGTHDTIVFFTGTTNRDVGRFQDALAGYPGLQVVAGDSGYVAHPPSHGRWYFIDYAYHDEWSSLMGNTNLFSKEYSDNFDPDKREEGAYGNGIANAVAIISYDAAKILLQGIEIARSKGVVNLTSQDLQAGLEAINSSNVWQGVSGQIAFDANHVAIDKALITLWVSPEGYIQMRCIQGNFASTANYSHLPKC